MVRSTIANAEIDIIYNAKGNIKSYFNIWRYIYCVFGRFSFGKITVKPKG